MRNDASVHARALAWVAPVAANVVLGCVGVVPLGLVRLFLADHPLAALGLTSRDPTDNDGALPGLLVALFAGAAYAVVWWGANLAVRRIIGPRTGHPRSYWPGALAVTLASVVVLAAFPHLWTALEQN